MHKQSKKAKCLIYIVKPDAGSSKTNIPRVFVAGDAADFTYRQAITAAGTGCMAALNAECYLSAKNHQSN